jgi:hypothetical protein
MLEIIIALLLALGVNITGEDGPITVIDQQTGICYGVGNTVGSNQGGIDPNSAGEVYILVEDDQGKFHLVRR